ncbi:uncharacterized protein ACNLHF_022898 isoform 1-T1 [Anomaloglossus baeobatrachus]
MKPRCCCSLFQMVDVTGMGTNPKVVSTDKELCLTASLGGRMKFDPDHLSSKFTNTLDRSGPCTLTKPEKEVRKLRMWLKYAHRIVMAGTGEYCERAMHDGASRKSQVTESCCRLSCQICTTP